VKSSNSINSLSKRLESLRLKQKKAMAWENTCRPQSTNGFHSIWCTRNTFRVLIWKVLRTE
jgi:hypothetical protein